MALIFSFEFWQKNQNTRSRCKYTIDNLQSWTKSFRQIYKIKENRFFYECITADFLRFFTEKRQNLAFGWQAGYLLSNPSISGIFFKFPNPKSLVVRQLLHFW